MAARQRRKVAAAVPACGRAHVDEDLLRDARKKAFVLLLATDGVLRGGGTYTHEERGSGPILGTGKFEAEALQTMAFEISSALAELGKQADGDEAEKAGA